MADEHAPGPSPAYDPWRDAPTPGQQPSPADPAAPQAPGAPQQSAPRRNPDGSWTVEVHPSDGAAPGHSSAYPQPRRPLTAPTPVQAPQPWMQQPTPQQQPSFAAQQPAFAPPQQQGGPRRGPRLGLILGIAIPVAVVAVGAVVAAIVVPDVLVDRDAQAAADDYAAQVADWESVYSDAALQPLAELDTAAFDGALATAAPSMGSGSYDDVVADTTALQTSCDTMAGLSGQAAMLTAPAPALRVVEGGERNEAYAAAVATAAAAGTRYEAAGTLADDVAAPFDAIASACALVLAQADADATFASTYDAYLATLTVPQGGTERYDVSSVEWITFTCNAATGCASFVDRAARATTASAWDAAFVAYNQAMAQSYRDHCPTADVQAVCDAWAGFHDGSAQQAAAVGAAYRDEDVTGGAVAGDAFPAPDLSAAVDAFVAGDEAGLAAASAETSSATGATTMLGAVSAIVRGEGQSIRDAASAVRG